jgi:hypothetical protein
MDEQQLWQQEPEAEVAGHWSKHGSAMPETDEEPEVEGHGLRYVP